MCFLFDADSCSLVHKFLTVIFFIDGLYGSEQLFGLQS